MVASETYRTAPGNEKSIRFVQTQTTLSSYFDPRQSGKMLSICISQIDIAKLESVPLSAGIPFRMGSICFHVDTKGGSEMLSHILYIFKLNS